MITRKTRLRLRLAALMLPDHWRSAVVVALGVSLLVTGLIFSAIQPSATGLTSKYSQTITHKTQNRRPDTPLRHHDPPKRRKAAHGDLSHASGAILVRPGDTLWSLSGSTRAHPWRWVRLWHDNRRLVRYPNLIYAGERLRR